MRTKSSKKQAQSQEVENAKNPLHRDYGLFPNLNYVLKHMLSFHKIFFLLLPLSCLCRPAISYLWTFLSKFVIDLITSDGSMEQLLRLILLFAAAQAVFTMLNTYQQSESWWRFIDSRFRLMQSKNEKVMSVAFEYLENPDVMDCYQKAGNACNSNMSGTEGLMRGIYDTLATLTTVLIGLIILGTMNPLILLLMTALALVNFIIRDRTNKKTKKLVWDPLAPWWRKRFYMSYLTTDFEAAKDIRMFRLRDWLLEKFRTLNRIRYEAQKKNARLWLIASCLSSLLWFVSQAAVYAWLLAAMVQGKLTVGNFSLYLASSATFFDHITRLLDCCNNLLARSREVDDFRSFMDFDREAETQSGRPVPALSAYTFTFRNVSFRYPKSEQYALRQLSLTLNAGERLAVVGLNGAGKSTFIKLLLRLYEPTEGEILLNGVNIKEYDRKSYYTIFSPIFQNVELFAFPLAENVSMQSPADTDVERAERCLRAAGFGEKLDTLPNGMNTELLKVIYDEGIDLSGGEKQKLALARALYKNAPVVVLDEPTAALDALAESRLYQEFDNLIGGKTAVYISHRLSSTQFCNHVALFADGQLKEYGTHESLLAANGAYAELFRVQAQYYVEKSGEEETVYA